MRWQMLTLVVAAVCAVACGGSPADPSGEGPGGAGGGGSGGAGGSGGRGTGGDGEGGSGGDGGSIQLPYIQALEPTHATVGFQPVVLIGAHMHPDPARNRVYFGGRESVVLSVNAEGTRLETGVPADAVTGPVKLITDGIHVEGPVFTVDEGNPVPRLASLSPARAVADGRPLTVTIGGTGFIAGSRVTIDGEAVASRTLTPTSIAFDLASSRTRAAAALEIAVENDPPGGGTAEGKTLILYRDFGLESAVDRGSRTVVLTFNEAPEPQQATDLTLYSVAKQGGGPVPVTGAAIEPANPRQVRLQLAQAIARDTDYSVKIDTVDHDLATEFGGQLVQDNFTEFRSLDSIPPELAAYGGTGCGSQKFSRPSGLARFPLAETKFKNNVLVVETAGHQIESTGTESTILARFWGWDGADLVNHAASAVAVGCPGPTGTAEPGGFSAPRGQPVFLAPERVLVFGDTGNGRLQTYVLDAYENWRFGGVIATGLQQPILLGSVGPELWVATAGNRIERITLDGAPLGTVGIPGDGAGEFAFRIEEGETPGLALAPDGAVLVTDPGNHRVQRWVDGSAVGWLGGGSNGFGTTVPCCAPGTEPRSFDRPAGVAVDAVGQIFVIDQAGGGRLQKFDPSGQLLWERSLGYEPNGIAVDWDGLLRISDVTADLVHVYSL